jgi:hypothetical protein
VTKSKLCDMKSIEEVSQTRGVWQYSCSFLPKILFASLCLCLKADGGKSVWHSWLAILLMEPLLSLVLAENPHGALLAPHDTVDCLLCNWYYSHSFCFISGQENVCVVLQFEENCILVSCHFFWKQLKIWSSDRTVGWTETEWNFYIEYVYRVPRAQTILWIHHYHLYMKTFADDKWSNPWFCLVIHPQNVTSSYVTDSSTGVGGAIYTHIYIARKTKWKKTLI